MSGVKSSVAFRNWSLQLKPAATNQNSKMRDFGHSKTLTSELFFQNYPRIS
jgi:hypothetical protein